MIERTIDWCNENRFILFFGVIALVLAGVWSLNRIPLDALPDISDVQVIIHTEWMGQPPNLIEDQVTYPIVTAMLAAPHVKAVRAQTMPNDSYVFVVFEDGTDIYWARSRVLEYLQQITGKLPTGVNPMIGPDATGAGWVYEYALVDKSHTHNLADLRSLQDWNVRYALETVPGVSEVATIGGFVKQYQVKLDPNRLLALKVPLQTVIDKIRDSNGEVGGRVLEMSGADYMIRGLGYVHSVTDLETDIGSHQQRYAGADKRLRRSQPGSRPARRRCGVERRRRDCRWHRRDALRAERSHRHRRGQGQARPDSEDFAARRRDRRWIRSFGTYTGIDRHSETGSYRRGDHCKSRHHHFSLPSAFRADPDSRAADRRHRDLHPHVLSADQLEHHVARRIGAGDRCAGRCFDRDGRERLSTPIGSTARGVAERRVGLLIRTAANPAIGCEPGRPPDFLLADYHRRLVPAGVPARVAGRTNVSAASLHQVLCDWLLLDSRDHCRAGADGSPHSRQASAPRG